MHVWLALRRIVACLEHMFLLLSSNGYATALSPKDCCTSEFLRVEQGELDGSFPRRVRRNTGPGFSVKTCVFHVFLRIAAIKTIGSRMEISYVFFL